MEKDVKYQYMDEKLLRLREIRASQDPPMRKIMNLLELTEDYDAETARKLITEVVPLYGVRTAVQTANREIVWAEDLLMHDIPYLMDDVSKSLKEGVGSDLHLFDTSYLQSSYCARTMFEDFDQEDPYAHLPEELIKRPFTHVSLIVSGMAELVSTFSEVDSGYKRPYAIMAELEQKMLEYAKGDKYPLTIDIEASAPHGHIISFKFSHFEADMSDPDPSYHTLYVVYSFEDEDV